MEKYKNRPLYCIHAKGNFTVFKMRFDTVYLWHWLWPNEEFPAKKNPKLLQLSNGLNSFTYSVKCRIRTWCFIWKGCGLEWIMVKSDSMKWNIDGWPLDRRCVKIMIFIFANFMKRIFISHHSLTCCFTVLTSEIYQYHFIKMIKMIYMCLCVCVCVMYMLFSFIPFNVIRWK